MFKEELEFFVDHQNELVEKYAGKILVIKKQDVIGVYDNLLDAYFKTQKNHALGTFMIQPCAPGPEAYTVTISSSEVITM